MKHKGFNDENSRDRYNESMVQLSKTTYSNSSTTRTKTKKKNNFIINKENHVLIEKMFRIFV